MKNGTLLLVSAALLALGACGKHEAQGDNTSTDMNVTADNGTVTSDNTSADNNAAATAPSPTNSQGFVNAAAASDKFEIETSKLAASAASSAAVKKFATQMISAHTASTAKLKNTLAGMSPPLTADDTLSSDQQRTLDNLKALKGTAFDTAYATAQQQAHQKTLDTLKNYAASGDNATLKNFANGLIPTVTAHLNLAKGLKQS